MTLMISWAQALAWRMERQLLQPIGDQDVEVVVRRLCGVQAQVASSADLAVRVRRTGSAPGETGRALAEGRLFKTWAMRGTLHLLTPGEGGDVLSLMASGRSWERPSWQKYFGMAAKEWEILRPAVREALDAGPLTREQLVASIVALPGLEHLGEALAQGWGTLLKPLAWQGDLCFGPSQGNRVTFARVEAMTIGWTGIPDPEEAAPRAIAAYLGAYGPATADNFIGWLARGWMGTRRVRAMFNGLGDRVVEVEVDGESRYVLAEHVDELAAARPSTTIRLLPGFDQYVLGPGTDDPHVLAVQRRSAVSRQSGWISPVIVAGGVVAGTWKFDGDIVRCSWFGESGALPRKKLQAEVARLAAIVGRGLDTVVTIV